MEVLLFALFFISALIFFIAGKDDFGRTESKFLLKEDKTVNNDENKDVKVADKGEIKPQEEMLEDKLNEKEKVVDKGEIKPQKEIKKDS